METFLRKNWILALLVAVLIPLLFIGLADDYLWGDEANTAVFAKGVLRTGLPSAWDGRNLLAFGDGWLINRNFINDTISPLQFYLVALFFKMFGASTFVARLPFVLTGILVVIVFYFTMLAFFKDRKLIALAAVLLALSPSFLLYVRQARYYALSMLCTIFLLHLARKLSLEKKTSIVWLALVSVLFFYVHSLCFAAAFVSVTVVLFLFLKSWEKLRAFILSAVAASVFIFPYFIIAEPEKINPFPWLARERLFNAVHVFAWYLRDINRYGYFPVLFLFALPFAVLSKESRRFVWRKNLLLLVVFILVSIATISYLTPQNYRITEDADMRYVIGLLPFMMILVSACMLRIFQWRPYLGLIVLLITLFSSFPTLTGFKTYLFRYLHEITHNYTTNHEAVCDFLARHGERDDTVFVEPEFHRGPLLFYLGNKFLLAGVLKEDTIFRDDRRLPDYVFTGRVLPDWIVTFGKLPPNEAISDLIEKEKAQYRTIIIDMYCKDTNRPEILWHKFRPVAKFSPANRIFIYQLAKSEEE